MGCGSSKTDVEEPIFANDKVGRSKVQEAFKKIDINGDGKLTINEIDFAIDGLLPKYKIEKKFIRLAHHEADADGSGSVELEEFVKLVDLLETFGKYRKVFEKLDKNGNGKVSWEEFKHGHNIIGIKNTPTREEYALIDADGSGNIVLDELVLYLAKKYIRETYAPKVDKV